MLSAMQLPNPKLPWPLPLPQVYETAHDEQGPNGGCALVSYLCPAGKWTNGWGETDGVTRGMRWTKEYADQRFCDSMTERTNQVLEKCTIKPGPNQLAAMVRLSYNIGVAALAASSIMRAHNAGNFQAAGRAFNLYIQAVNPATGKFYDPPLKGLISRRARESALYLTPEPDDYRQPMPQAITPESSLARSPIANSGAVTAGAGVVTAVINATEPDPAPPVVVQPAAPAAPAKAAKPDIMAKVEKLGKDAKTTKTTVQQVKEFAADTLGIPSGFVLPAVLIVAGVVAIYWRRRQRAEGWA